MRVALGLLAMLAGASEPCFAQQGQAVVTSPAPVACLNRSGTIAVGGVAQPVAPFNSSRKFFLLQNPASGQRLTFTTSGTASTTSIELAPGSTFVSPPAGTPDGPISIWGATTGQPYTLEECS